MLKIIQNNKSLFKSLLRSDLFPGGESPLYIEIPDENNSWDNADEIIKEIISDKVINWKDLPLIKELSYKFYWKQKGSYKRIRNILNKSVQEMIEDWFSVKGEDSYRAISKLLIILKGVMMPEYKKIKDSINDWNFSLAIDWNNIIVYLPSSYENIAKKVWEINLMTWEYITDSSWYEIDYKGNNNKIDLDNEVIDFEVLKDNYQKEKILNKPEWMEWNKPKKRTNNVANIMANKETPMFRDSYNKTFKEYKDSLKQIRDWNKKVQDFKNTQIKKQKDKVKEVDIVEKNIEPKQIEAFVWPSQENELNQVKKKTKSKYNEVWKTRWLFIKKENIEDTKIKIEKKVLEKEEKVKVNQVENIEKLLAKKEANTKEKKVEREEKKVEPKEKKQEKEKNVIKGNSNEKIKDAIINQAIKALEEGKTNSLVILPLGKGEDKMSIKLERLKNQKVNLLDKEWNPIITEGKDYYQVRLDTKYFDWISDIEIPFVANSWAPTKENVLDSINKIKVEYKKSLKQRNKNNLEMNEILKEMFGEKIDL